MVTLPNEAELKALISLSNNDDFKTFLSYLEKRLSQQDQKNRYLIGEHLYRGQGAAIVLSDLIYLAPAAREKLKELNKQQAPGENPARHL